MMKRCRGCKLEKDAAKEYYAGRTHCRACHARKTKKQVFPTERQIHEMYAGRRYDES
tara:strand:- start:164 stop:334 length:171 start_codon:yes stop_codon:yes gene_type:complete